jgi:hypothetical protein
MSWTRELVSQAAAGPPKFYLPPEVHPTSSPRLVNRFRLGADPEFTFEQVLPDPDGLARQLQQVPAELFNMKTGVFAGADQNGRLVELRPKPSRSALRVLASTLVSLRWLARMYPQTLLYGWRAGAFAHGDGLGGHVHFGRKRPSRPQEVQAMDALMGVTCALRMFPAKEQQQRQQGDARRQRYGLPGDFRLQVHGYEYRSLPSWLDSPWQAYLTLVLSKLAVLDPALVVPWGNLQASPQMLRNLLAYYRGLDDDAALALAVLSKQGLPQHLGGDFKQRWGLNYEATAAPLAPEVLPPCVAPSDEEVQELFSHLLEGSVLASPEPKVNWPTEVPKGYKLPLKDINTRGQVGLGELIWDIVTAEKLPIKFHCVNSNVMFYLSTQLAKTLPGDWEKRLKKAVPEAEAVVSRDYEGNTLSIGLPWRKPSHIGLTKKALLCGAFPLWRLGKVHEGSLAEWQKGHEEPKGLKGEQLYPKL